MVPQQNGSLRNSKGPPPWKGAVPPVPLPLLAGLGYQPEGRSVANTARYGIYATIAGLRIGYFSIVSLTLRRFLPDLAPLTRGSFFWPAPPSNAASTARPSSVTIKRDAA